MPCVDFLPVSSARNSGSTLFQSKPTRDAVSQAYWNAPNQGKSATGTLPLGDRGDLAQLVAGIVVHRDRLIIRLKSDNADQASDSPEDWLLSIPWRKPPSKKSRQMLLPHNASRSEVGPEQFERRARLVSAIARGRRWLDDVVSGRLTTVAHLCTREKCWLGLPLPKSASKPGSGAAPYK